MCSKRVKVAGLRRRARRRARRRGLILGLTGSVAMGKSTAAQFLKSLGIPVFDADAAVHRMMGATGIATAEIAKRFPGVVGSRGVDRKALGAKVFADPKALAALEAIVHPLVQKERAAFLARAGRKKVVAFDIPLLFEGAGPDLYDAVVVVSAPEFLQRQRALARPGMTAEKLKAVRARQWPDSKKRQAADAIVPTSLGKRETLTRLKQFLTLRTGRTKF